MRKIFLIYLFILALLCFRGERESERHSAQDTKELQPLINEEEKNSNKATQKLQSSLSLRPTSQYFLCRSCVMEVDSSPIWYQGTKRNRSISPSSNKVSSPFLFSNSKESVQLIS